MPADKIVVIVVGLLGIISTYWFFFMKKTQTVEAVGNEINISVEGGYKPDKIVVPFATSTKLIFERKDPSSCLEEVVLSDFKIKKFLPLNEKTAITITPNKKGVFDFSCGMNMFHGKLIVK